MVRHQGFVQKNFYFPKRMLNVRVYFLALVVIFCTWGQVNGGSFSFILTQIWFSHGHCVNHCNYLEGMGVKIAFQENVSDICDTLV